MKKNSRVLEGRIYGLSCYEFVLEEKRRNKDVRSRRIEKENSGNGDN